MLTDRNLLFGVLALQADLLNPVQFAEACTLWSSRKDSPLADLLVERGWLTPCDRADIEKLLERKLRKHQGDARASLMEVTTNDVRRSLAGLADADIHASIAPPTPPPLGHVLLATTEYRPEGRQRYTLSRLHATGGIGRVWVARDPALGRDVALKELRPERSDNSAALARFLREAQVTGQLEHPGVVPIYEVSKGVDATPFYTMRLVRGRTLAEAAEAYHKERAGGSTEALGLRRLVSNVVGVCNAIAYAHSRGVLHRDLKPQNVVLGDYGEVIVLDWGLAKVTGAADDSGGVDTPAPIAAAEADATLAGQVLGTPAYMAPEQAEGRLDLLGPTTDVYGLGAILYQVLTDRPPFPGNDTMTVLRRVVHDAVEPPRSVVAQTPPALDAICRKALAKRPADRYAGAADLAADLERWLADEPVTAWQEPLSLRLRRWGRRHRLFVTSGGVALLVAVPILIAGILLLNQSEQRERHARQQAEEAERLERQAREQAEASHRRALRAADAMTDELARGIRPILGTERPTVVAIVDRANRIYEELLADPSPSREAVESQARTLGLFAELQRETGQTSKARRAAETSLGFYDRLLAANPDDKALRIAKAKAVYRRAWILLDQGHDDESVAGFQACAAELEACGAADDPKLAGAVLASAYTFLGNQLFALGEVEAARKVYLRGFKLRADAAAQSPKDVDIQIGLGISMERVGNFLSQHGDPAESQKLMRQACGVYEGVAQNDPWNSEIQLHLVRGLNSLAQAQTNPKEIEENLTKSRTIADRFALRDPSHLGWQRESLRCAYLMKQRESKAVVGSNDKHAANLRSQIELMEELEKMLQQRVDADVENYFNLADVANFQSRIGERHLDLTVFAGADVAELGRKARKKLDASLGNYDKILKRSPNSVDWQQGRIVTLFQIARASEIGKQPAEAAVNKWTHFSEELKLYRRLVEKDPQDGEWQKQLVRALTGASLNFFPRDTTESQWAMVLREPKVSAALVELGRQLHSLRGNANENVTRGLAASRKLVIKNLEAVPELSEEGKRVLEELRK